MKSTKIRRIITAAAAVVLTLSLSLTALAEGSDPETQPPELPEQQSQASAALPDRTPDSVTGPEGPCMPGQGNGSFFGEKNNQGFRQGMRGQKPGNGNRMQMGMDDVSAAINNLEDGETKENLIALFDAWKAAMEAGQNANGSSESSTLTEAETALNAALKSAGLSVQAGRPACQDQQDGFESGFNGNVHRGMKGGRGMAADPFAEVRSAIDQIENGETKAKLTALLDALTSAIHKGPAGSAEEITSAETALNEALTEAGISIKVGKPDSAPKEADPVPSETPASETPASDTSVSEKDEKDVSELLDILRSWLKGASD